MAKVKQPLEENGIHRAKMWEIMMYACLLYTSDAADE